VVARHAESVSLDVRRSRGSHLPRQTTDTAPAILPARRWEQLRQQIHTVLNAGSFGFNVPLPLHKELQHRYGAAPRTIRRALRALANDGVLERYRNGYRMKVHAAVTGQNRIGLFLRGTSTGRIEDFTSRTHNYVHALEAECLAHGVLLQPFPAYPETRTTMDYVGRTERAPGAGHELDECLGIMIWPAAMGQAFMNELAYNVANRNKSLAFFWDNDEPRSHAGMPGSARLRHFTTQNDFDAGRTMGLYLLHLGHRNVRCFFAENRSSLWVSARLAGLRKVFADAGMADAVTEHNCRVEGVTIESTATPWVRRIIDITRRAEESLAVSARIRFTSTSFNRLNDLLLQITQEEQLRKRLQPALEQTLAEPRITAWVGMNDAIALECLNYLRHCRVEVPRYISVTGFDDNAEAAFQGLTSYSFNGAAAMHAMVEYLLHPDIPRGTARPLASTGVEGFVHERGTSGPARRN